MSDEAVSHPHSELLAVIEKYVRRGYAVEQTTATTATLARLPRKREALLYLGVMFVGILGGGAPPGVDDGKRRVHLYVDEGGQVYRKGGWRSLLPGRFRGT